MLQAAENLAVSHRKHLRQLGLCISSLPEKSSLATFEHRILEALHSLRQSLLPIATSFVRQMGEDIRVCPTASDVFH